MNNKITNGLKEYNDYLVEDNTECTKADYDFSTIFKTSPDLICEANIKTASFTKVNPAFIHVLGYSEKELLATKFFDFIHPDDINSTVAVIENNIKKGKKIQNFENRYRTKAGGYIWLNWTSSPNIETGLTYAIARNITERKRGALFIENNAKILKMIATGQPPSIVYDAIALMYEARHPGMRCSMLELKGNKLMHGGAPSLPKEYCDAVNGLENGPNIGSCGTSTYTGKRVLVEDIATDPKWAALKDTALPHGMRSCWSEPIRNPAGEILGAFGMYYNHPALPNEEELKDLESAARLTGIIMERKRAEDSLKNAKEEIEAWNKKLEKRVKEKTNELLNAQAQLIQSEKLSAMGQMAGGLAHELNSPLGGLLPMIENYKDIAKEGSKDYRELSLMLKACTHMAKIVKDFGSLSRESSGKFYELSLNSVIEDTLSFSSGRLKQKGIQLIKEYEDNLPNIQGEQTELQQVVLNMITNACDATPKGGKFIIKTHFSKESDDSIIEFIDNGTGIKKEYLKKIFDPFYTTKRPGKGTGLGLSVSYKIIEKHGGKITVKSEPGKGTNLSIYLPVVK